MCGALDAHEQITDAWKRFKTLEEAEKTASAAGKAKDETKVAYTARNRNIFRVHKVYSKPGSQSVPENPEFSSAQSVPAGPGAQSVPTVDISGGGGNVVDSFHKRRETKPAWAPPAAAPMLTIGVATPKP
jgi:hypothetical protein